MFLHLPRPALGQVVLTVSKEIASTEGARLAALRLGRRETPPQRHMQEKTQTKVMIPKISNSFFHREPRDPKPLIKSPRLGVGVGGHLCPHVIY